MYGGVQRCSHHVCIMCVYIPQSGKTETAVFNKTESEFGFDETEKPITDQQTKWWGLQLNLLS